MKQYLYTILSKDFLAKLDGHMHRLGYCRFDDLRDDELRKVSLDYYNATLAMYLYNALDFIGGGVSRELIADLEYIWEERLAYAESMNNFGEEYYDEQ